MPDYSMRGPKPKGNVDPDKFADDLVAALKETGKQMKGAVKRIRVVDDTVNFTVEPTAVAEKIIEALKRKLGVDVHPATTPLDAFAEKYGIAKSE